MVLMIKLAPLHFKDNHSDAGIQKAFPNAAFGLPNGRKWTPKEINLGHATILPLLITHQQCHCSPT